MLLGLARTADMRVAAADILDVDESRRHAAMQSQARREEFVAGRLLAKQLLAQITNRPASSHTITIADTGKPVCKDGPEFSISHSKGLIACAVAEDAPVGVDIEVPSPARNTRRISRAHFTEQESAWLADAPVDSFYRLWVLKEAWLKASGSGLAGGLGRLNCTIEASRIHAQVADAETPALLLYEWRGAPVGVSIRTARNAPEVFEWSPERAALVAVYLQPKALSATPRT
jgi:4'-phosphopantetheinyl transferase